MHTARPVSVLTNYTNRIHSFSVSRYSDVSRGSGNQTNGYKSLGLAEICAALSPENKPRRNSHDAVTI